MMASGSISSEPKTARSASKLAGILLIGTSFSIDEAHFQRQNGDATRGSLAVLHCGCRRIVSVPGSVPVRSSKLSRSSLRQVLKGAKVFGICLAADFRLCALFGQVHFFFRSMPACSMTSSAT